MRVLISSLQVSQEASRGHLHPALEIGNAIRQRGHEVAILPLPSPICATDRQLVEQYQLQLIDPPPLPPGLPLPREQLAELANNPETVAQAFHSFVVAPLQFQFEAIVQKIKLFAPDSVIYDLLVYGPALAARSLNIPDIGFCAGLKLIAPPHLTRNYSRISEQLAAEITAFLTKRQLKASFHQLELLSDFHQLVFVPETFFASTNIHFPPNTLLAGALPTSMDLREDAQIDYDENDIVLCFGSVLDPADYPEMTSVLIKAAKAFNRRILIVSSKLKTNSPHAVVHPFLPLPQLLKKVALLIHHGGANTFSESLTAGTPQLIIPLTTDQPIQAEILRQSAAGVAIYPNELTEQNVHEAFSQLLDRSNVIHQRINEVKTLYENSNGAVYACQLIEKLILQKVAS